MKATSLLTEQTDKMEKKLTILIVDDDEDDIQLFIESAKEVDENITCLTAADGQEALRYLKDENNPLPDFIFLDLRMPRINGRQFLDEIKKDERLSRIKVFIYTTSIDTRESIELKQNGALHFISKPDNPTEIYYILSVVLHEIWDQPEGN